MSDQEDRRPTLSSINISFDCVIKLSFMTVHAVFSLYRPPKHLFPTILNAQLVSDRVTFRSQSGMFFLCLASGFFLRKPCLSCPFLVIFLLNLNFDHVRPSFQLEGAVTDHLQAYVCIQKFGREK